MADTTMSVPRPRVNGTGGLTLSSRSLQLLELISVLDTRTVQGCSHQYDWSGFNRTTFRDNNHISANILEFGGMSGRPVGSHVATVDRVQIDGAANSLKVTLPSLQSMKVPREPILIINSKIKGKIFSALCTEYSALHPSMLLPSAASASVHHQALTKFASKILSKIGTQKQ